MEEDTIFEFNIISPCYLSDVFLSGVQQKKLIDIDNLVSKPLTQCVDKFVGLLSIPASPTVRRK